MRAASLALLVAPCLGLNLVEMKPLAAAMLAKRWATDQAELDQKIGIRDDGVTGVLRFGDDLRRRTEVAKALDMWQKTSLALAGAQKARNAQATLAKSALVELTDAQNHQQQVGPQGVSSSNAPAPTAVGSSARGKKSVRQAV